MKIALITDAWQPQVNGVVNTLVELVRELEALGHDIKIIYPGMFKTRLCPGYAGIDLAVSPKRVLTEKLDSFAPQAIYIATEDPLGWAARSYCIKRRLRFTTAFHTKFSEILHAALKISLSWGYALFRYFHKASSGVMVPTSGVLHMLAQRGFKNLRGWTHGVDNEVFAYQPQPRLYPPMATGTPVAAYPVDGPLEVLGKAGGPDDGLHHGGVLHADLQQACYEALTVPRREARLRALDFSWTHAAQLFEGFLVSAHPDGLTKNEQNGYFTVVNVSMAKNTVTPLTSNQ